MGIDQERDPQRGEKKVTAFSLLLEQLKKGERGGRERVAFFAFFVAGDKRRRREERIIDLEKEKRKNKIKKISITTWDVDVLCKNKF